MRRFAVALGTTAVLGLFAVGSVHAAATPEQKCQKGRLDAAAKYALCHQKVLSKYHNGSFDAELGKFDVAMSKCRVKYQGTWPKLQARLPDTTCAQARFEDNGDETVTDNLTALVWEKKNTTVGSIPG